MNAKSDFLQWEGKGSYTVQNINLVFRHSYITRLTLNAYNEKTKGDHLDFQASISKHVVEKWYESQQLPLWP